jgi:hypothetical protein
VQQARRSLALLRAAFEVVVITYYCESMSCSATLEVSTMTAGDDLLAEGWELDEAGVPWCPRCLAELQGDR